MYNCHYQFEVSITAIYIDSQMWGISKGSYVHAPLFYFKEHNLMLCCFCLAALKGIRPSLQIWSRYLLVGRSILHQGGRPMALHPDTWAACLFHSPSITFCWPCLL